MKVSTGVLLGLLAGGLAYLLFKPRWDAGRADSTLRDALAARGFRLGDAEEVALDELRAIILDSPLPPSDYYPLLQRAAAQAPTLEDFMDIVRRVRAAAVQNPTELTWAEDVRRDMARIARDLQARA